MCTLRTCACVSYLRSSRTHARVPRRRYKLWVCRARMCTRARPVRSPVGRTHYVRDSGWRRSGTELRTAPGAGEGADRRTPGGFGYERESKHEGSIKHLSCLCGSFGGRVCRARVQRVHSANGGALHVCNATYTRAPVAVTRVAACRSSLSLFAQRARTRIERTTGCDRGGGGHWGYVSSEGVRPAFCTSRNVRPENEQFVYVPSRVCKLKSHQIYTYTVRLYTRAHPLARSLQSGGEVVVVWFGLVKHALHVRAVTSVALVFYYVPLLLLYRGRCAEHVLAFGRTP